MLLQSEDTRYPVLMQQRASIDCSFKVQPQSVRLNSLVLLLVQGHAMCVTTGAQLKELAGTGGCFVSCPGVSCAPVIDGVGHFLVGVGLLA